MGKKEKDTKHPPYLDAHSIRYFFVQWDLCQSLVGLGLKIYGEPSRMSKLYPGHSSCLGPPFMSCWMHAWRRQWRPTPVLLPGKSHGWRSLVGCSPWGRTESDMTERLHFHFSLFTFMHWRGKWQPTPVFLPGESQGRGSLVGCSPWGRTESDTTEAT